MTQRREEATFAPVSPSLTVQLPDIPGLTPEHLRQSSNLAHTIEGVLLLGAAAIAGAQAIGKLRGGRREYLGPLLLISAGVFLLVYLPTHHGIAAIPAILRYAVTDAQQRQHFLLATIALAGGVGAYTARRRELGGQVKSWRGFLFSAALMAIGFVFLLHPQHGTSDAVVRARTLHVVIGALFIASGTAHAFSARRPASRSLSLLWPIILAATALTLMMYREPPGAYEMGPHQGMRGMQSRPMKP